ncbi:hypothetical protein ACQKM2_39585 [Streptomyces sp. NPDC004126]|uniref:hypothetical protein n=1 Tax=Streptomyces sp. NPDC004126 TaxID=3390695 RepID=UPI003D0438DE
MTGTVVVDFGSGWVKAGVAGKDEPGAVFPNVVGVPRAAQAGVGQRDFYVGDEAAAKRATLTFQRPAPRGGVEDWEAAARVWAHTLERELRFVAADCRVLVVESPFASPQERERTARVLFEELGVRAAAFVPAPVLALRSACVRTGVVVDLGDGVVSVSAVHDGRLLPGTRHAGFGGRDLTGYLSDRLMQAGHSLRTPAELEVVRDIRERLCYVAEDLTAEMHKAEAGAVAGSYELPDAQLLPLGSERFDVPEALFAPDRLGLTEPGLHELVHQVLTAADAPVRAALAGAVRLSGGLAQMPGLAPRLAAEAGALTELPVKVAVLPEPACASWIGGSRLAADEDSFADFWVGRQKWAESGAAALAGEFTG